MSISRPTPRQAWGLVLFLLIGALVVHRWHQFQSSSELVTARCEPEGVMGTRSSIVAVMRPAVASKGAQILSNAEAALRREEMVFSTWIKVSELSRVNTADAGAEVLVSPKVIDLLTLAHRLFEDTEGALDVTAGPLIELWREAPQVGSVPDTETVQRARDESTWDDFDIREAAILKNQRSARLDVDGIAKGYAIDRAVEALARAGAVGGLVEVGGDLRTFGASPEGESWAVGIQSPFGDRVLGRIELADGAICTSGSYARPLIIDGRKYSHIIDPRTGAPVAKTASVTVIAPNAVIADAWATALSVLGAEGLALLPHGSGIEALVISGDEASATGTATAGFPEIKEALALRIERR